MAPRRYYLINKIISIAGTHTTSATISLLFYHLLHSPEIMAKCVAEIDSQLPPLSEEMPAYSVTDVEASLPYLRMCVRENFRITPVFTMPLARRVVAPKGVMIAGEHIKQGVSLLGICSRWRSRLTDVLQPLCRRRQSPCATTPSTIILSFGVKTTMSSTLAVGSSLRRRKGPDT